MIDSFACWIGERGGTPKDIHPPAEGDGGIVCESIGTLLWMFTIELGLKLGKFPLMSLNMGWFGLIRLERIFIGFDWEIGWGLWGILAFWCIVKGNGGIGCWWGTWLL